MELTPNSIVPSKGLVLLRALWPEKTDGGLYIPLQHRPRWTPIGEVFRSSGVENLKPGDWVIIEDESHEIEHTYFDVFRIVVRDLATEEVILAPIEQEPQFREMMQKYYNSPSEYKHDYVSIFDVMEDQWVHFNPPDVKEFGLDWQANPTFRLDYIPTVMLNLWTGEKYELFYLIDERRLLLTFKP